jgi:hypothetical protein
MSLALSSTLRSFAGFVHHHGPAVFFHLTTTAAYCAPTSDRAPAAAIERVAEALLVEEETQRIVSARELMRARP